MATRAALKALLREDTGYSAVSVGGLCAYRRGDVSLPGDQTAAPRLADLLPPLERSQLENFSECMLLGAEERGALCDDISRFANCYHDLGFNCPQTLACFVCELYRAPVTRFTETLRVSLGVFFVSKKSGKLRMILDARRSNLLFKSPPRTALGSIEALSRLDLTPAEPGGSADRFFVAQEDVRDFFYRLGVDRGLSDVFALPPVESRRLLAEFNVLGVEPLPEILKPCFEMEYLVPALAVLPMGFSWAFHLAHKAHEHLAGLTLEKSASMLDKKPVSRLLPSVSTLMIYADNANHLALSPDVCNISRLKLSAAVNACGLATHKIVGATRSGQTLGAFFDGFLGIVSPTAERSARLGQGLLAVTLGVPLSSHGMRRIVGHITS